MKKLIIRFFRFQIMQYKWGRKFIGGKFYLLYPRGLQMADFWSDEIITSCQTIILKTEEYKNEKN
jgi:hypothetical protein